MEKPALRLARTGFALAIGATRKNIAFKNINLDWRRKMTREDEQELEKCGNCQGFGYIRILRNNSGQIDYINGQFTGETEDCRRCDGEGFDG